VTTDVEAIGPKGRMATGVVFIAFGLLLVLDQAGILQMGGLVTWWPLFLIGAGVVKARQPVEDGQRSAGVALLFVGGFFLWFTVLSWGKAWPLLLIMVGGLLLWQAFERPRRGGPAEAESPFLSELGLMGVARRSVRSLDFRGGYITAVMGGVELDLRKCRIAHSPARIDLVAVWGGIELKVPADWVVEGRVVPVMGAFLNKAQCLAEAEGAPRLVLSGSAVMGGVEISN
jgi:hypothetical protein